MGIKIGRALLSVSDKTGLVELATALVRHGAELVATGRTAGLLMEAGFQVVPVEQLSGSPEVFQGRMKTLSFQIFSGILFRRGDEKDERDAQRLRVKPIDCVVVNFYPFEATVKQKPGQTAEWIENIDIGGPSLVRAAAKNAESVLILSDPTDYASVLKDLEASDEVQSVTAQQCASRAWDRVAEYDHAIASIFGSAPVKSLPLRYGENPHQKALMRIEANSPIAWDRKLTDAELSYNNILDVSAAYSLCGDLIQLNPGMTHVVIVKHNGPCGVASWRRGESAQLRALEKAWEGDPTSAFGGVLIFSDPIADETAGWLASRFVELVAAPGLTEASSALLMLRAKRKNLKAVLIVRFGENPDQVEVRVPGGRLLQDEDRALDEVLRPVTAEAFSESENHLARFGISVCRALKSNAVALVRELVTEDGGAIGFQLVGTGQGQPNRVVALKSLAIPRAIEVLGRSDEKFPLSDCLLVSDAFFPFRDTVDAAAAFGIRKIVQPGGSARDSESIEACNQNGIAMAFTGVRHFRH